MKGIPQSGPRCALAKLLPSGTDTEKVKRDGWRDHQILVVNLNDPRLDFVERQMVQQLGETLYGRS